MDFNLFWQAGRRLLLLTVLVVQTGTSVRGADESPIAMAKQFSADQVITMKNGATFTNKIFIDNGKMRTEMAGQGMNFVSILLPDQQKIYSIMPAQKMVMVMPYDAAKIKSHMDPLAVLNSKFELIGPETLAGVPCMKYKSTSPADKKSYFFWIDPKRKLPVQMTATDGSFTVLWKNYQAGPQDPSLFVVPTGYQIMDMPNMPDLPAPGEAPPQ